MDRKEILQHQFETLDWIAIYQEVEQKNVIQENWFSKLTRQERELRRNWGNINGTSQ